MQIKLNIKMLFIVSICVFNLKSNSNDTVNQNGNNTENIIAETKTEVKPEYNKQEDEIDSEWEKLEVLIKRSQANQSVLKDNEKTLIVSSKNLGKLECELQKKDITTTPDFEKIRKLIVMAKNKHAEAITIIHRIKKSLTNCHLQVERNMSRLKLCVDKANEKGKKATESAQVILKESSEDKMGSKHPACSTITLESIVTSATN